MGTTNFGGQALSFDYKAPGKSETFNKLLYQLFPTGIYDGGLLSYSDSTHIDISPFTAYIVDSINEVGVRVQTSLLINLSVSAGSPFIIARFSWSNVENNYVDILATDFGSILADDLIIGRCVYLGGILQSSFDYTRKSKPIVSELKMNEAYLSVIPKEPYTNTVYVNAGNLIVGGNLINFAGGDSPAMSDTDGVNGRIDLVYIDSNGNIKVLEGIPAVSPAIPSFPSGIVLAKITRPVNSTYITGAMIERITPVRESSKKTTTESLTSLYSNSIPISEKVLESYSNKVLDSTNLTTANWINTSSTDVILNESYNNHLFTEVKNTTTVNGYVAQTFAGSTFTNTEVYVKGIIRKGNTNSGAVEFFETSSQLNVTVDFDTKGFTVTAGTLIRSTWIDDYTVEVFAVTDTFTITNSSELRCYTGSLATTGSAKFTEMMILDITEEFDFPFVEVSYTQSLHTESFNLPNELTFDIQASPLFKYNTAVNKVLFSYYIDATHKLTCQYNALNDQFEILWQDGTTEVKLVSQIFDDGTSFEDLNQKLRFIGSLNLLGTVNDSRFIVIADTVNEDTSWSSTPDNKTSIFTNFELGAENSTNIFYGNINYIRFYDGLLTDTIATNIDADKVFINKQVIFELLSTGSHDLDLASGTDYTTVMKLLADGLSKGFLIQDSAIQERHLSQQTVQAFNKGKFEVTISNYDNESAPIVKAGSTFENNGKSITVLTDQTPTGYSTISVSTTFYLAYDLSKEEFYFTSSSPTWSDTKQGWYNGDDRYLFGMYKDSGGTLYQSKTILTSPTKQQLNTGLDLRGNVNLYNKSDGNVDRTIDFASDASILWDESTDKFVFNKKLDLGSNTISSGEITSNAALNGTAINTGYGDFEIGQNLRTTDNVSFHDVNVATGSHHKGILKFGSHSLVYTSNENGVFDALKAYVPTNGDWMLLHGIILGSYSAIAATRTNSTTITAYYIISGSLTSKQYRDGVSNSVDVNIRW